MIYRLDERHIRIEGSDYFIAPNATVIGSVVLKDNASIWFNAVVRADNDYITIGEDSNIQDGAVLHTDSGVELTLGKGVTIGHLAMVHGCEISDYSLVGINAVILNRVKVGKHCIIGANSLIPEGREIPDGSLVMGTPAKIVRQLTEEEIQGIYRTANNYVQNFKRYKANSVNQ